MISIKVFYSPMNAQVMS